MIGHDQGITRIIVVELLKSKPTQLRTFGIEHKGRESNVNLGSLPMVGNQN